MTDRKSYWPSQITGHAEKREEIGRKRVERNEHRKDLLLKISFQNLELYGLNGKVQCPWQYVCLNYVSISLWASHSVVPSSSEIISNGPRGHGGGVRGSTFFIERKFFSLAIILANVLFHCEARAEQARVARFWCQKLTILVHFGRPWDGNF
jgi:hypothetical protein